MRYLTIIMLALWTMTAPGATDASWYGNLKDKIFNEGGKPESGERGGTNGGGGVIDENSPFFQRLWNSFSDISSEASALAVQANPAKKTTFEFLTLQEPKYKRLLREARDILSDSEASEEFEHLEKLINKNKELNNEIVILKNKRISAPASSMNPLVDTKKSIDRKLESIPEEINENNNRIDALKNQILDILNRRSVPMTTDELNYFIVSAEGEDLMQIITVAENMKRIQNVIARELKNDKNNVELAKIYTGMYLISLDAYLSAHDTVINNIRNYRERLAIIREEAKNNHKEAKKLSRVATDHDKANIESNLKINERTIEVANIYDDLLNRRAESLTKCKNNVENKVKIARNTYRTIVNGATLISLVNDSSNEYSLLINFEMPELKNMHDEALMSAFVEISDKIRAEK